MKFLFEFFPILLFFLAYKWGDIYIATIVAMVASLIQVIWSRYKHGFFETVPLITLGTITLLGGATLLFKNELFIKWKPTVVYWVLALVFLFSQFFTQKSMMQRIGEKSIPLSKKVWGKLNLSWVVFFGLMGIVNLYVAYNFDTDSWVKFKLFGTLGLTVVFILLQSVYMITQKQSE